MSNHIITKDIYKIGWRSISRQQSKLNMKNKRLFKSMYIQFKDIVKGGVAFL